MPAAMSRMAPTTFTKKTYTWKGLINSYTLTAYYTKGKSPALHHIEAEGEEVRAGAKPRRRRRPGSAANRRAGPGVG